MAQNLEAETPEQRAQRVLDQRKYLVVWCFNEYKPGDVIKLPCHVEGNKDFQHPLCVVAETDREDYKAHCESFGPVTWEWSAEPLPGSRYYQVTAE